MHRDWSFRVQIYVAGTFLKNLLTYLRLLSTGYITVRSINFKGFGKN